MANLLHTSKNPTDILRKAAALVVTVILIGLALMFSMLIFAAILVVGAMAWGYLWWNTRALRKQMRDYPSGDDATGGEIIEGEIIPNSSLDEPAVRNQGVVGRVLTRPLRQAQDRHVGLKPDLRPNGLSGIIEGEIIEGEATRVADPESPGAYEKTH